MDRCTRKLRHVYHNWYTHDGSHRISLSAPCIADNLVGTFYVPGVVSSSVILTVAGKRCNRLSVYCWSSRVRLSSLKFRQILAGDQQSSIWQMHDPHCIIISIDVLHRQYS